MGAESSVQRDGKSQEEDASATATASGKEEVKVQEGDGVPDTKSLQKNGQISSMSSLNGHSEDNTLAEVGQPDGVSVAQKEEAPEIMDAIQDEVAPQVNGEKVEKETADANDISVVEEKAAEEKTGDTNEVGFKKIFRFVGFKFTLKKDKSEEKDPVKLLNIKEKDGEEVVEEAVKEEEAATVEETSTAEEKEADTTAEAEVNKDTDKAETTDGQAEAAEGEVTEDAVKEEKPEKEEETVPATQEVISPFRKIFSGGLFSNLRKKASIKKTKEDEDVKEETAKAEEAAAVEKEKAEQETKKDAPEESQSEAKDEAVSPVEEDNPKDKAETEDTKEPVPEEAKTEAATEVEATAETPVPATDTTDEAKQQEEKAALEVSSEAELLSSQEKAKPQGSPLKKLFTGAGLKKLSTKKQKSKKDAETKLTESGEQAEQVQLSTESTGAPKAESGPSSPEESGEHVIAVEVTQTESSQETDGEVTSDGEKKKEGIIAWSSFKKLVTPKKRVKRPSESDDETAAEKPAKSATLSSTESATLADKSGEEETKDENATEEEPKTETTEKLTSSTEEKKKMDTSVSWEALMCMGGPKKRARKTSDSDDDETKVEEQTPAAAEEGEQEGKAEAAVVTSQTSENEGEVVSSPEPISPPASAWDTLKRMVTLKRAKSEEKAEESAEQVLSDSEAPKEESSFFLKKFFPGRRKKKAEKQLSAEQGSGEEDSDTPAVVPLSEYDAPPEAEQEKPAEVAAVQAKVTTEERSPSWISATVEDTDDKQDQLSDIPEEAESAATPKSVDTDVAEDEDQASVSPKPVSMGRRLSTAEVKPVAPTPSSETTTVPTGPDSETAQEVLQSVEAHNIEIPAQTSVAVEDVPVEAAAERIEYEPPTETAEANTNTILEVHAREEAMAICTGLGTKEIAKVALEKPGTPVAECMAVVRDALSTEVSIEKKPANTEQAIMSEDSLLEAQVHQVDTTQLECMVEKTPNSIADIQVATESMEPQIEKVGITSTVLESSEVIQIPTVGENSPKAVVVDPIIPISETAICTQSIEVTEPTVEMKEVKMDMEQLVATEENTPVKEVVQVLTNEISSAICDNTMTTTKETEPEIPVVLPSEVVPVISETVVLVAPVNAESEKVSTTGSLVIESVPVSELVNAEVVESESSVAVEQASEKASEGELVNETIETQSMVIAQNIVQEAVDKVSEGVSQPPKPSSPFPTIPTPDQAVATIEKDIEIKTETPVITDTPVPVICAKTAPKALHVAMEVTDTIAIEVTESIAASVEKKTEELKQDEEVKVSEETDQEEEKEEVKEESQEDESERSKKDTVEEEQNVNDSETLLEEAQTKVPQLHIPVQVVLQTAQILEEPSVEEEAVVEFDSNGPVDSDVPAEEIKTNGESAEEVSKHLPTVSEEPQEAAAAASQSESETSLGKCAEVMAQVIEVIEEAVKEIEPVSTEITAAS